MGTTDAPDPVPSDPATPDRPSGYVSATDPRCRCGHPKVWHRRPGQTTGVEPDDRWGACEITGPQPGDGCDCQQFEEA